MKEEYLRGASECDCWAVAHHQMSAFHCFRAQLVQFAQHMLVSELDLIIINSSLLDTDVGGLAEHMYLEIIFIEYPSVEFYQWWVIIYS